jgi:YVTN family beta-propeller protein
MNDQPMTRFAAALALAVVTCSQIAAQTSIAVVVNSGDSTASVYSAGYVFPDGDPILRLLKVLPVGKGANEVCLSPAGDRAYVSNRGDISVTVLDLKNLSVASTIMEAEMKNPDGCIVSADGAKLYVAAAGGEAVFVFSTADGRKLNEIKVGREPRRLLFSPDGSRLYVSNGEERFVSVVDVKTGAAIGKIKAGRDNRSMVITPDGKYLVIGNVSDDTVQFVKLGETEPEFTVGVPRSPQRLVAVPSKQLLLVIGRVDNVLSILDVRPNKEYGRLQGSIPIGRLAWGMALSAAGDCLYVANTGDNTISIIDLRLMRSSFTIFTGKGPMGLAVH